MVAKVNACISYRSLVYFIQGVLCEEQNALAKLIS